MPADSLLSQIQLAVRAGRFEKGEALIPSIQSQRACLVVQSGASGANRAKKLKDKCTFYHIPLIILPELRFNAISQKVSGALAVTDPGFAGRILALARQEDLPVFGVDPSEERR